MSSSSVASATSYFPTPNEGFTTTSSGTVLSGANTVGLNSTTGLTNGTIFVGIIEPGGTKEQTFTGTVSTGGSSITGVVWTRGTNVDHASGVTIVDYVTGTAIKLISTGILVEHTQAGRHVMTSPKVITDISDTNGNELMKVTPTASAVNEITLTNAATGNNPQIAASGGDTNISLALTGKGSGGVIAKNPYKFSATRASTAFGAGAETFIRITINTEDYDTSSNFDSVTNSRFVAPITGVYHFSAGMTVLSPTAGEHYVLSLFKNGSEIRRGNEWTIPTTGVNYGFVVSADLLLTAADYIELWASGGNGRGISSVYFAGHLTST